MISVVNEEPAIRNQCSASTMQNVSGKIFGDKGQEILWCLYYAVIIQQAIDSQ